MAIIFVVVGMMLAYQAPIQAHHSGTSEMPEAVRFGVSGLEHQSGYESAGPEVKLSPGGGSQAAIAAVGGPTDFAPLLSLQGQSEPAPPNPLIYLDIWLFGGLILLVMAVAAFKYLVKLFRPDDRDPEEGLQPWEDPDFDYEDYRE